RSKAAATSARSPAPPISSSEARAPSSTATASIKTDFPAPVSPDRTLRPGPKVRRARSTIAMFSTVSSSSKVQPPPPSSATHRLPQAPQNFIDRRLRFDDEQQGVVPGDRADDLVPVHLIHGFAGGRRRA